MRVHRVERCQLAISTNTMSCGILPKSITILYRIFAWKNSLVTCIYYFYHIIDSICIDDCCYFVTIIVRVQ